MDDSEALVEKYLRNIGFTDIQYEPNGNTPPDFVADRRVAVEVRRLNQNYDDRRGRGPRGLEETAIPLWRNVQEYLAQLGPAPPSGQSWYVFYRFGRPIPKWKTLRGELDSLLKPFMAAAAPQPFQTTLPSGIELKVFRAPVPKPSFFRAVGHSDAQSGGWLLNEIATNLQYCITEKTQKIAAYRSKYPEWWLVLPDHIGFGLDEFDQELFRHQISITHTFDKIILLDPRDASRVFEL
jgi:hypothetical protein